MKVLSHMSDKAIKRITLIFMILLISVFFYLDNRYDISYDYIRHPSDYTKAVGVISNTYSKGRPKYYRHYVDIEYEWNGEVRKLTKAKRGLFEKRGREAVLYINNSSGSAVRGITFNYMDVTYFLILAVFIFRWGFERRHSY